MRSGPQPDHPIAFSFDISVYDVAQELLLSETDTAEAMMKQLFLHCVEDCMYLSISEEDANNVDELELIEETLSDLRDNFVAGVFQTFSKHISYDNPLTVREEVSDIVDEHLAHAVDSVNTFIDDTQYLE